MAVVTGIWYFSAYAHSDIYQICNTQILNSNPNKQNKSISVCRSRSLLVASLSGGDHAGCKH